MHKRSGQSTIHMYLNKKTGKPKGDAPVSYEDPLTAKAAVEWFDRKDFQGSKLKVSLARKKTLMNRMWGFGGCCCHSVEVQEAQEAVTKAEVAFAACKEEEVASWTEVVPVEHSEVEVVETEVVSMADRAWMEVTLVEEDEKALGVPLDL
ncbi:hypothetical protein mRhiFer1_007910 [Rhinolophus ferrumequinum]|uniref:RRM domain-containing protein n=1 Tax=Rhinolophus ferrumequinum TaxID=59479 RepID=A0A7J8AW39_RHIFE|nr:hypothetical protein mRhiFer1_007910 [Rhinolophus ferrumequinum]